MRSDDAIIATRGLKKQYGAVRAVDDIELNVREGEIYGFLGRNGAGKTTTIRMILGLIRPTSGQVLLRGKPLRAGDPSALAGIGSLVESATAYPNLTVLENLDIQRRLTGCTRSAVDEVVALLRLEPYAERRAGQLSLGNRQRLALARAVLGQPRVLVLDEPANALDPAGIAEIRELLRRLAHEHGSTIFMSSHILGEVAHVVDRVAIIHAGKLVEEVAFADLRRRAEVCLEVEVSEPDRALALLSAQSPGVSAERSGDLLRVPGGRGRAAEIAKLLVSAGLELTRLTPVEEDLEAYFMRATGGPS